jgi:hypothetical protein
LDAVLDVMCKTADQVVAALMEAVRFSLLASVRIRPPRH